ncbi:transmembrane protein 220-like [Ptychodera flava]|uniref:transmembrane protein 220-like n=1 Tax=Ptychodera flava TaxID=63121 RepID=UPI00396A3D4C
MNAALYSRRPKFCGRCSRVTRLKLSISMPCAGNPLPPSLPMDDDTVTFGVSKDADKICSSRMIIWKAVNVVMAIFFLLCALAQVNDPDPYIWTPIYLVPCLLTAVVTFRKNTSESPAWKWLLTIHIAACLVGIVYLTILVLELMNGQYKDNPLSKEEGRELAGLLTVVVWLSIVDSVVSMKD